MQRRNRAKLTRSAVMLALVASPIIGCHEADDADEADADDDADERETDKHTAPTYEADVKPIITSNCVSCHVADGIAPMPLDTYSDAKAWAPEIKRQVLARTMPPWSAGPDCNEYLGDRRLSETQLETIAAWVDAGARRGKPGASKVKAKSAPQPLDHHSTTLQHAPSHRSGLRSVRIAVHGGRRSSKPSGGVLAREPAMDEPDGSRFDAYRR